MTFGLLVYDFLTQDLQDPEESDPAIIGAIIGIIVGLIATVVVCVLCLIAFCCKNKGASSKRSTTVIVPDLGSNLDLVSLKSGRSVRSGRSVKSGRSGKSGSAQVILKNSGSVDRIEVISEEQVEMQSDEEKSVVDII